MSSSSSSSSPRHIIGVTGVAGSGKSTFTDILLKHLSNIEEVAFATPLKEAAKHMWVYDDADVYDPMLKEKMDPRWGKTPRQNLQWLGTQVFRDQYDKDFLIKNLKFRLDKCKARVVVISDVRFDNEAEFVCEMGGTIVRITRPSLEKKEHVHESEMGIKDDYVDFEILNDGSMEDFEKKIYEWISRTLYDEEEEEEE